MSSKSLPAPRKQTSHPLAVIPACPPAPGTAPPIHTVSADFPGNTFSPSNAQHRLSGSTCFSTGTPRPRCLEEMRLQAYGPSPRPRRDSACGRQTLSRFRQREKLGRRADLSLNPGSADPPATQPRADASIFSTVQRECQLCLPPRAAVRVTWGTRRARPRASQPLWKGADWAD